MYSSHLSDFQNFIFAKAFLLIKICLSCYHLSPPEDGVPAFRQLSINQTAAQSFLAAVRCFISIVHLTLRFSVRVLSLIQKVLE